MNDTLISYYRLRLADRQLEHQAPELGTFFGKAFEDEMLEHTCGTDGRSRYDYPRVQFKIIDSEAVLIGIAEGAELVTRLCRGLKVAKLGGGDFTVLDSELETQEARIAAIAEPVEYRFLSPWLGLNQKNFRAYVGSRSQKFRRDEIARILVGNCLGLIKSLGIRRDHHIEADGRGLTSIKTTLSGGGVIGFIGKFRINCRLPELLGLGRFAANGFGAVREA